VSEPAWPDDAVEVGRIVGAWGVKGGIKVLPYSSDPKALFSSRRWFIKPPARPPTTPRTTELPALLKITDRRDAAVVRIRDHGEGIAPEDQARIFRRFYRVDKSRSQEIAGTGLGLAVTKHLILRHGGAIDVESVPGEGATFIVTLSK